MKLSRLRLDDFPLPKVGNDDSKEDRGVVLTIGGSDTVPGAIRLAALGALRAGAGKLQIATSENVAIGLGIAVPEALVLGLPVTDDGELDALLLHTTLERNVANAKAILVGPGMSVKEGGAEFLQFVVANMAQAATLVVDGPMLQWLAEDDTMLRPLDGRVILTPHAGEMASLLEIPLDELSTDAAEVVEHAANRFGATVVFKGSETWISAVDTIPLCYRDGKAGLGTSGSGDVLAGVVAGLAARGASTLAAASWAVWAHGSAGNRLARSIAPIGFLASELLVEVPALLND